MQTSECFLHLENFKEITGMKIKKVDIFLTKALTKMFELIGEVYSDDRVKEERWFSKKEWSEEKSNEFKVWFCEQAKKDLRWDKNTIEKEYGWFNLMWGWKIKK